MPPAAATVDRRDCTRTVATGWWPAHALPEDLTTAVGATLCIVFGSISYSWNPQMSKVLARLGGPKHAATTMGLLDLVGFGLRVPFSLYFGLMLEHDALISTALGGWMATLLVAHTSMVALLVADELVGDGDANVQAPRLLL